MAQDAAAVRIAVRSGDAELTRLDRMNLAVLAAQTLAWGACLALASRLDSPWLLAAVVVFFCFMMQGVFSMMHEAFHGHAHRNPRVNAAICWLSSTLFGASATLIRINHLGHHVRNRTSAELVDYAAPGESLLKKTLAYYAAILGGIWLGASLGSLLLALVPGSVALRFRTRGTNNTYAAAFADFRPADFARIRVEVLAGVALWLLAFRLLALDWQAVLLCYAAFALTWSSLQWIYHVRTPLHVVEGTYNVRTPRFVRALFLNFNYNLTHHRRPAMRWQHMHAATDLALTRPFWRTWLAILKPPRPLPSSPPVKTYF